jgi:hypothetical protein
MEQLVHLRLKSIYKAFQQSARTNDSHPHLKRAALAAMKKNAPPKLDQTLAKAQADAAAAELLAELEEEEAQQKTSAATKKKKRKKKKKLPEDDKKDDVEKASATEGDLAPAVIEDDYEDGSSSFGRQIENRDDIVPSEQRDQDDDEASVMEVAPPDEMQEHQQDYDGPERSILSKQDKKSASQAVEVDPLQTKLCDLVQEQDVAGIESLLQEMKGIPGKAGLRKNAKKALKRLREEEQPECEPHEDSEALNPLVKVLSTVQKSPSVRETVLEMDPSIVGYIIGKGGQKIRDLMDESAAKVWIDQDSMSSHEPRVVYVSGAKKAVQVAVQKIMAMVQEASRPCEEAIGPSSATTTQSLIKDTVPSGWIREEITCEPRFVPLLIGRRGWTIKHIQDTSGGAKIDINQSVTPRIIILSGTPDSVAIAREMVEDVLAYPHAKDPLAPDEQDVDVPNTPPPPSSYVTTGGDMKSIVSASSSLSSTPEPSMASSTTNKGAASLHPPPPGIYENRGDVPQQRYVQPPGFNSVDSAVAAGVHHFVQHQQTSALSHPPSEWTGGTQSGMSIPQPQASGTMGRHHQIHAPPQVPIASVHHQHLQSPHPHQMGHLHMNHAVLSHQIAMQQHPVVNQYPSHKTGFLPSEHMEQAGFRSTLGNTGINAQPIQSVDRVSHQRNSLPASFFDSTPGTSSLGSPGFLHSQPSTAEHTSSIFAPDAFHEHSRPLENLSFPGAGLASASRYNEGILPFAAAGSSRNSSALSSGSVAKDMLPGRRPAASPGAGNESNLVDSLFGPSTGSGLADNSLLAGLKGLNVGNETWADSGGPKPWSMGLEKSRLSDTQQQFPTESRFQWGA